MDNTVTLSPDETAKYQTMRQQALSDTPAMDSPMSVDNETAKYQTMRQEAMAPEGTPKPQPDQFGLVRMYEATAKPFFADIAKDSEYGTSGLLRGFDGAKCPDIELDDVCKKYEAEEQKGQQPDLTPVGAFIGPAMQALAPMAAIFAGEKIGAVTGNAAGGFVTPVAAATAAVGAFVGAAAPAMTTTYGNLRLDFHREGIPPNIANPLAVVGGALLGGLQITSFGLIGRAAQRSTTRMALGMSKKAVSAVFHEYMGNIGLQAAIGGASAQTEYTLHTMAALINKPHLPTYQDVLKGYVDMWQSFKKGAEQGAQAGAVLTPIANALGSGWGRLKAIHDTKAPMPMSLANDILHAILTGQRAPHTSGEFVEAQSFVHGELSDTDKQVATDVRKQEQTIIKRDTATLKGRVRKVFLGDQNIDLNKVSPRKKTIGARISSFINSMAPGLRELLHDAVKFESDKGTRESMVSELSKPYEDALRERQTLQKQYMQELRGYLEKYVGKPANKLVKMMVAGAHNMFTEKIGGKDIPFAYVNDKGEITRLTDSDGKPYTINEALKLWLQMQDPSLYRGLKAGNGFTWDGDTVNGKPITNTTEKMLRDNLPTDYKKAGIAIQEFGRNHFSKLARAYFDETGEFLEWVENWAGPAYREGYRQENLSKEFQAQLDAQRKMPPSAKTGSVIERVSSKLPLAKRDAFADMFNYINGSANYEAWAHDGRAKTLRSVFLDPMVQKILGHNDMNEQIDLCLRNAIQGHVDAQGMWSDVIKGLMSGAYSAFVLMRPLQYPKHVISGFAMATYQHEGRIIPPHDFILGWLDYYRNPAEANKILNSSQALQDQFANLDRTIIGAVQHATMDDLRKHEWDTVAGIALHGGIAHAEHAGGWSIYNWVLKITGGDKAAAMKAFEQSFLTTQSTGDPTRTSNLQAAHPLLAATTKFRSQETNVTFATIKAWRDQWLHPSAANFAKAIYTTCLVRLLAGAFKAVDATYKTATATETDDKKIADAWWEVVNTTMNFMDLPVIGSLINQGYTATENVATGEPVKRGIHGIESVPTEVTASTLSFAFDIMGYTASGKWDAANVLKTAIDYSRGPNVWIPSRYGGHQSMEPILKLSGLFVQKDK